MLQVRGRLYGNRAGVRGSDRPGRGGDVHAGRVCRERFEREASQHAAVPNTAGRRRSCAHLQPAQQTPAYSGRRGLLGVPNYSRPGIKLITH